VQRHVPAGEVVALDVDDDEGSAHGADGRTSASGRSPSEAGAGRLGVSKGGAHHHFEPPRRPALNLHRGGRARGSDPCSGSRCDGGGQPIRKRTVLVALRLPAASVARTAIV
jgi:hypothetical protein